MAAPNRELEPSSLRLRKSELAAAWADISHALRGFYGLADILIVLDEVLLLEISNFARQLKFSPVIGDDHPGDKQINGQPVVSEYGCKDHERPPASLEVPVTREEMWPRRKSN